jgi:putative glycosyltransferase (TIGR04372 family)
MDGPYKKRVFYPFIHVDRIGETADQLFCLKNLYATDEYNVSVITFPPEMVRPANREFFTIATRGMNVIYTEDGNVVGIGYKNPSKNKVVTEGDKIYLMLMHSQLKELYRERFGNEAPRFFFSLSDDELREGETIQAQMGIPDDARIVCLYVRDGAYFGDSDDQGRYKNADINSYLPSVRYLVENGYYVVRIGDPKMHPLKLTSPQIIDTPFHPAYTGLVEPYFVSKCEFMLGSPSGPLGLANFFNKPGIFANAIIDSGFHLWLNPGTLFLFKKYFSTKLGRCLTYEEVLLSPAVDFYRMRLFDAAEIVLIDNTSEEILAATREMIARLSLSYELGRNNSRINRKLIVLHEKVDYLRQRYLLKEVIPYFPHYSLHSCK